MPTSNCLFCRIAAGEIPATTIYSDDHILVIADINPQAPVHLLAMPRAHVADAGELAEAKNEALMGKLFAVAARLGRELGSDGFRLVANAGQDGGQTVDHLHVHVLAGRAMTWPPG